MGQMLCRMPDNSTGDNTKILVCVDSCGIVFRLLSSTVYCRNVHGVDWMSRFVKLRKARSRTQRQPLAPSDQPRLRMHERSEGHREDSKVKRQRMQVHRERSSALKLFCSLPESSPRGGLFISSDVQAIRSEARADARQPQGRTSGLPPFIRHLHFLQQTFMHAAIERWSQCDSGTGKMVEIYGLGSDGANEDLLGKRSSENT